MSIRTEDLFHIRYLIQEKKSNYFRKYLRPQNLDHSGHHKRSSNSHKNADRRRNRPHSTIPRPAFPPEFRRAIWPRNLRRASYALMEISKQRGHGVCRDKEWMTERIVLRAAGSEAGRPGTEFTAGPNDAAGCSANRNRCKNLTAARLLSRRPLALLLPAYEYRYPLEPPGENEFHKVSHEVFYVRAKKL